MYNCRLCFPDTVDPDAKDILLRLLDKDPEKRIKMDEIKAHPWTTDHGRSPIMSTSENCRSIEAGEMEVTESDIHQAVSRIATSFFVVRINNSLEEYSKVLMCDRYMQRPSSAIGGPNHIKTRRFKKSCIPFFLICIVSLTIVLFDPNLTKMACYLMDNQII